jgi:HEAT repeat protein
MHSGPGGSNYTNPGGAVPAGVREPTDPTPPAPPPATPDSPPAGAPSAPAPAPTPTPTPTPLTPPPSSPVTPGGIGDGSPTGGSRRAARDDTTWETWWEMNRFEFLAGRRLRANVTREDDLSKPLEAAVAPEVLGNIRQVLASLRTTGDSSLRKTATIALARLAGADAARDDLRAQFIETLEHAPNGANSWTCAVGLGFVADESTIPFLHRSAANDAWPCGVRVSLAMSMPVVPSMSAAVQAMLPSLIDEDESGCAAHVSMAALVALGESGDPAARAKLETIFKDLKARDARPELRALALTALTRQGPETASVLLAALGDKDVEVRRSAALGLGVLDWRGTADRLIADVKAKAARRGAPLSADEASLVLQLEAQAKSHREVLEPIVRETVKRLSVAMDSDRDRFVQSMAAISLGRVAGESESALSIHVLERDLARRRQGQREYDLLALALAHAPSAFDAATAAVRGKDEAPTTRGAGAIALGLLGDERGRATLREALRTEPHPTIRGYIALALGMLGDRESVAELRAMVERAQSPRAVAYGALGLALVGQHADAVAIVRRLAETSDDLVAPNLVHALRLMGDRRAVGDLLAVAANPSSAGRSWAAAALGYATTSPDAVPRRLALARGFNYLLPCGPLIAYIFEI